MTLFTPHQKGREEPPEEQAAGFALTEMQLLLLRACGPVRGVVSGNCIRSSSATEHKTPTFTGRGLVVALGVPAPRRDVTETPQPLCVPAAPGRALAEAPAVWLCCPRAVSHGLGLHILIRSQASLEHTGSR